MNADPYSLLIVDDDEPSREGLARRLSRQGYEVCCAAGGSEALEVLGERSFDLVLLDVMMPGMNGLEVLESLRRTDSLIDLPVIMVTARGESTSVVEALDLGANDYLTKPLDMPVVLARIRTQLALKRAEEALRQADRRKDEFLAVLGHELRNPLAPLRNALRVLRLQCPGEEVEQLAGVMDRQVDHLVRLVDDLLDVTRISRGKIELRTAPLDLAAVLERCLERVRPHLEERQHALETALPEQPLPLEADPARLEQVFTNLLINAGKYTPPGGHVRLSAAREGDRAVVRVRDDGIGIRPEMLARVFEMFQQSDRVPGMASEGLGLGLALVRGLVAMHGGSVAAFSDGTGTGSEFVVTLPLAAPQVEAVPDRGDAGRGAPSVGSARRPLQMLVVDDNVDGAQSLAMLLGLIGHKVRVAHDGPEALEAAAEFCPEVVLLDIRLPRGMDGYEVARRLRALPGMEKATLVALTGYGGEEERAHAREAGFAAHFVKPVDVGVLCKLLDQQRAGD